MAICLLGRKAGKFRVALNPEDNTCCFFKIFFVFYALCHKNPRWHFTTLKDAARTAWTAGTLRAQKHNVSSNNYRVPGVSSCPSSLECTTSAQVYFSHLLGSCSLSRLSKGVVYNKKCLSAGEMASSHLEASDCGNVC